MWASEKALQKAADTIFVCLKEAREEARARPSLSAAVSTKTAHVNGLIDKRDKNGKERGVHRSSSSPCNQLPWPRSSTTQVTSALIYLQFRQPQSFSPLEQLPYV
jgi:hypothetical protein